MHSEIRRPGPEVIKLCPCSTQMSTEFTMLINVKMPPIAGILTFINKHDKYNTGYKNSTHPLVITSEIYKQVPTIYRK